LDVLDAVGPLPLHVGPLLRRHVPPSREARPVRLDQLALLVTVRLLDKTAHAWQDTDNMRRKGTSAARWLGKRISGRTMHGAAPCGSAPGAGAHRPGPGPATGR